MANLTFYFQVRVDGGKRAGIEIGGTELLCSFEPGHEERDPTLLWYIDIDCKGDCVPEDPQEARNWLVESQAFFVGELKRIADEELGAGFDVDARPFLRDIARGPGDAAIRIRISAIRRVVAREMAQNVRQLASEWSFWLQQLEFLSVL